MKNIIPKILLSLSLVSLSWYVLQNLSNFSKPFDYEYLSKTYSNSQYVVGSGSSGIGDDGLYAFAGYYYITGGDPTQVNFEHPPLGKYLIGLSIILFQNENLIYLIYGFLFLFVVYKLFFLISKNSLVSALSVFLMSIDQFFLLQLKFSLLDLPLALFFTTGIYFLIRGFEDKRLFWLSSLFLGLATSTKFFPSIVILVPILVTYIFFTNKKILPVFLFSLTLIPAIYILSYSAFFFSHNLTQFISFQKWMLSWRLNNPTSLGNIFSSIFTGQYWPWFPHEGMVKDNEWTILLPVIQGTGLMSILFFKKLKIERQGLLWFIQIVFLVYLSIGTVGVTRYILVTYPISIGLTAGTFIYFFAILNRKWNEKKRYK